jgi:hypothetical protein
MLASSQVFHLLKFAAPILIICWSIFYFSNSTSAYTQVLRQFKDEKQLFVSDFLEHEVDGAINGSSIADLCNRQQWTPGLFLSCESPPGGVGNVKNAHLNCIRIAIEIGAELILPGIIKRNDQDISVTTPNAKAPIHGNDMDYFFDMDHLNSSMATYCPQLRLHRSINDLWEVSSLLQAFPISLQEAGVMLVNQTVIATPSTVGTQLREYINKKSPPHERKHPVRFNLRATYFAWPTISDGEPFARHFGRILRIRSDARRIAAAALFNLHKRFSLGIDPRLGLNNESFVGVHLRTEKDTELNQNFPTYEEQAAYYLDYAVTSKSRVVFLATGASQENITAFVDRARDFNITTVLKKDILDAEDVSALGRFSYDQRALVDYEIMLRAGLMTGTSESSFAWNLAMRRRNAYRRWGMVVEGEETLGGYTQWRDRFSTIFGQSERGPIMQQTIWP